MGGIVTQNINRQSGLVKAPEAGGSGAWTFISKVTASGDTTISIASGIDSTYKVYLFTFKNIHPQTDAAHLQVNFRDGSTAYDAPKTTTAYIAYHQENDGDQNAYYLTALDLGNSTAVQKISGTIGNLADESFSGTLLLYNPASTDFSKHFFCRGMTYGQDPTATDMYFHGYCNGATAIDGVQFTMSAGNIDSGDICLYGLTV